MAKGYRVSSHRTIADPEKLAAYNNLAGPAVQAGGGRLLVRGGRVVAHDAGRALTAGPPGRRWGQGLSAKASPLLHASAT